jgi:hypothetical protein
MKTPADVVLSPLPEEDVVPEGVSPAGSDDHHEESAEPTLQASPSRRERARRLAELEATLLARIDALPDGKSLDPTEVARSIAGRDEKVWRLLMVPIRTTAVRLAESGRAAILRKGRVVDPADFKGVYRIGRASQP